MIAILAICILVPIAFAMGVRIGRWHELDRQHGATLRRLTGELREDEVRALARGGSIRTPRPGAWRRLA